MSTLETGLCGELFKAGETNSNFKLRWFHLHPNGELTWSETVEQAPKGTVPMRGATVKLEAEPVKYDKGELRYGFVITPAGAPRTYRRRRRARRSGGCGRTRSSGSTRSVGLAARGAGAGGADGEAAAAGLLDVQLVTPPGCRA